VGQYKAVVYRLFVPSLNVNLEFSAVQMDVDVNKDRKVCRFVSH